MNKSNLKLQALICVANPDLEDNLIEILQQNGARGINILLGHGARKFNLLEFGHNHKSIIISFIKSEAEDAVMQMIKSQNLNCNEKSGNEKTIAFTINVDAAAGGKSIFSFYDKIQTYLKEKNHDETDTDKNKDGQKPLTDVPVESGKELENEN